MKLIQSSTKREFAVTKAENKRLPKRFAGTIAITIDGNKHDARVTTNAAWSKDPSHVLEYFWFEHDGTAYYVTTNYAEPASAFQGEKFKTAEGSGPKPVPRITADTAREAVRIELFKTTYAARHAS